MKKLLLLPLITTLSLPVIAEEYKILFVKSTDAFLVIPYDENGFYEGIHKETGTTYDPNGYDVNGYDSNGFDSSGIHKDTGTVYNPSGYDVNGQGQKICRYSQGTNHVYSSNYNGQLRFSFEWDNVVQGYATGPYNTSYAYVNVSGYQYTIGTQKVFYGTWNNYFEICRQKL